MSKYESSVGRDIGIIHQVPGLARHAFRPHPHAWTVDVWFEGDPIAAEGMGVLPADQRQKVLAILDEYDGKDIGPLMPAGTPSLEGFAMTLFERLTMVAPGLKELNVTDLEDPARESFSIDRKT